MRYWIATFSLLLIFNLLSGGASGCSTHDHFCNSHGMGRAVNHTINQGDPTAVFIISEGSNSLDFDNHALLQDGHGPYIGSQTNFPPGSANNAPYASATELPRHVAPGQYQIDFQNGTVQAAHSGDLNGLNPVPNPPGCVTGGPNCEEIVIRGNIPDTGTADGFVVRQTNHLYNVFDEPNPEITINSYGVATGRAFFINQDHLAYQIQGLQPDHTVSVTNTVTETLSGTGTQGQEITYNIGYNDFDAHAAGVVVHYDQTRLVRSRVHDVQFGHVMLSDGTQSHQYDAHQRQNTYAQFDRTYDFTQFVHADTGLPALHLNDQETARWDTWSNFYGATPNAAFENHQREQEELRLQAQERFESDWARGCLDSTCSNLPNQSVWPGVDMAMADSPAFTFADVNYQPDSLFERVENSIAGGFEGGVSGFSESFKKSGDYFELLIARDSTLTERMEGVSGYIGYGVGAPIFGVTGGVGGAGSGLFEPELEAASDIARVGFEALPEGYQDHIRDEPDRVYRRRFSSNYAARVAVFRLS